MSARAFITRAKKFKGLKATAKGAKARGSITKRANAIAAARGYVRSGGYYGRFAGRGAEHKFLDTGLTGTFDTTGEVLPGGGTSTGLNLIAQGTTESNRVGRKCVITKILIRGHVTTASTEANNIIRMLLVLDKQANGAYPAYADVLTSIS